jgi:uncharacterized protein (TIGR03437 family)
MLTLVLLAVLVPGLFAQPTIYYRSIVNAASLAPAGLPAGGIARGSIFTIQGANLGPAVKVEATAFPLDITLAGVSVRISQGGTTVNALPLAVSANTVTAVMPSNAPLGLTSVRVVFNGPMSNPERVRIVDVSPGLFSVAGTGSGPGVIYNYIDDNTQPANTAQVTALPSQTVIVEATGLGAIATPDNQPPLSGSPSTAVEVTVGGMPAKVLASGRKSCCAGRDTISFQLPDNVPTGCWVPVYVRSGGVTSNAVTMTIDAQGAPCSEPSNPVAAAFLAGGNAGVVRLLRSSTRMDVDVQAPLESANDFFHFDLSQTVGGDYAFGPTFSQPPAGSCTIFFAAGNLLKSDSIPAPPSVVRGLDAGPPFTLSGPGAPRMLAPATGEHTVLLGSFAPFAPGLPNQLSLAPGAYTISAPGGADVGPFSATVTLPAPFTWTSRNTLNTISRAQPLTLAWTGLPPGASMAIRGSSVDRPSNSSAGFYCIAPPDATSFTVPAAVISALSPSRPGVLQSQAAIYLITAIPANGAPFTANGLDAAVAIAGHMIGKTVIIQ